MAKKPFAWNRDDPLAKCKGETLRAHAALLAYWGMGEKRSLEKLHQTAPKPPPRLRTLKSWSSRCCWQARVAQAAELRRREAERIEAQEHETRIRQAIRDELEDADLLRRVGRVAATDGSGAPREPGGERGQVSPGAINAGVRAIAAASSLRRLALSMPERIERQEQTGAGGGPIMTAGVTLEQWREEQAKARDDVAKTLSDFGEEIEP